MNAEVIRVLGINYKHFIASFCAVQKQLAFLSGQKDEERQTEIAKMLKLDRLKLAAEKAKTESRQIGLVLEGMLQNAGDPEQSRVELKRAELAFSDCSTRLDSLTAEESRLRTVVSELKQRRADAEQWLEIGKQIETLKSQIRKLTEEAVNAKAILESARQEVTKRLALEPTYLKHKDLLNLEAKLEKAREANVEMETVCAKRLQRQERLEVLRSEIVPDLAVANERALTEARTRVDLLKKQIESERGSMNEQLEKAKTAKHRLDANCASVVREILRAEELIKAGKCPTCGEEFKSSFHSSLDEKKQELATLEAQREKVQSQLDKIEKAIKTPTKDELDLAELTPVLLQAEKQEHQRFALDQKRLQDIATIEKELTALDQVLKTQAAPFDPSALSRARAELAELRGPVDEYLALAKAPDQLAQAESKAKKLTEELETSQVALADLERRQTSLTILDPQEVLEAKAKFDQHSELLGAVRGQITELKKAVTAALLAVQGAHDRYQKSKDSAAEIATKTKYQRHYKEVAAGLDDLRKHLNKRILPDLETRASDHLHRLTDGRYSELRLDEKFAATIIDGANPKPVISGGEEDVVALALRLSLSELIQERIGQPMSLLILDEVFSSLDERRRALMLGQLDAIKGSFQQILVISHISEVNEAVDQCFYLHRDEATESTTVGDTPPGEYAPFELVPQ